MGRKHFTTWKKENTNKDTLRFIRLQNSFLVFSQGLKMLQKVSYYNIALFLDKIVFGVKNETFLLIFNQCGFVVMVEPYDKKVSSCWCPPPKPVTTQEHDYLPTHDNHYWSMYFAIKILKCIILKSRTFFRKLDDGGPLVSSVAQLTNTYSVTDDGGRWL